jgi:hypothetical protein
MSSKISIFRKLPGLSLSLSLTVQPAGTSKLDTVKPLVFVITFQTPWKRVATNFELKLIKVVVIQALIKDIMSPLINSNTISIHSFEQDAALLSAGRNPEWAFGL